MNKKRVKLAVIRKDNDSSCPFGLSIPNGCKIAGEAIDRMFPLEGLGLEATDDEKEKIIAANKRLLSWMVMNQTTEPQLCKYAGKLFPGRDAVDCNFGDTAAGQTASGTLLGSPFYSQFFAGIGLDGLYSYPLGFYGDSNISRNLFYGIYSLQGSDKDKERLIKIAIEALYNAIEEKKKG